MKILITLFTLILSLIAVQAHASMRPPQCYGPFTMVASGNYPTTVPTDIGFNAENFGAEINFNMIKVGAGTITSATLQGTNYKTTDDVGNAGFVSLGAGTIFTGTNIAHVAVGPYRRLRVAFVCGSGDCTSTVVICGEKTD